MQEILLLVGAGLLGGAINAIAGGGGILTYPALLVVGLPPIMANATASMVAWPGALTSAYSYRKELRKVSKKFFWLIIPCFSGAVIGALLLVHIDPTTFQAMAPWLVLSAVILMAWQSRIQHWLLRDRQLIQGARKAATPLLCMAVFPLAIYGGFFGAGFGLIMLAFLGFTRLKNIHQMNGIKNLAGTLIAMVSSTYFVVHDMIDWRAALIMICGTVIGGYAGAHLAQKISPTLAHDASVVIGFIISVVLIVQS